MSSPNRPSEKGRQRWTTRCGGFALVINLKPQRQIDRECSRADQQETGGVLIGHYTEDESTAIVTEASGPPRDSSYGPSWFHRGVAGLKSVLARRWNGQQRTYYLGEWHYHPADFVEPSNDDLTQMRHISVSANYRCTLPEALDAAEAWLAPQIDLPECSVCRRCHGPEVIHACE